MQLTSLLLTKYQRTWADKLPRVPIAQTQPKHFLLQSAPLVLAWQFLPCWLNPNEQSGLNGKQGFGGYTAVYIACICRQNGLRCPRNGETVYALHVLQCVAAANKPLAACPAAGKVSLAVVLLDGWRLLQACCLSNVRTAPSARIPANTSGLPALVRASRCQNARWRGCQVSVCFCWK